jgi:hypothetical protein
MKIPSVTQDVQQLATQGKQTWPYCPQCKLASPHSLFNFGSRTALHTNSLLEQAVIGFERKTRRDAMYGITFQRLRCKARLRS